MDNGFLNLSFGNREAEKIGIGKNRVRHDLFSFIVVLWLLWLDSISNISGELRECSALEKLFNKIQAKILPSLLFCCNVARQQQAVNRY